MEYLNRKLIVAASENSPLTGQQQLAKLIQELEQLDAIPRPIVRPRMKPLHADSPVKS